MDERPNCRLTIDEFFPTRSRLARKGKEQDEYEQ